MMMMKKKMTKISANFAVAKTILEVAKQPVRLKRYNSHTRHVVELKMKRNCYSYNPTRE